jgi:hypothetical protein
MILCERLDSHSPQLRHRRRWWGRSDIMLHCYRCGLWLGPFEDVPTALGVAEDFRAARWRRLGLEPSPEP